MPRYVRFIVTSDQFDRVRCTGVVTSLRILAEQGRLATYHRQYADEIFSGLNAALPCPPFSQNDWGDNCVCWFKDVPAAQDWISQFRNIIAILEDSDVGTAMLTTDQPGAILYEDDFQIVSRSDKW